MAKAQRITFSSSADDLQASLASVLSIRFDEVLKHREGALDPVEITGVHDMRVALRRLRCVIRDFVLLADESPLKDIRKTLKKLGDWLGAVRDADVLIEALERLSQRSSERSTDEPIREGLRDGLEAIIDHYRKKRVSAFSDLEKELSEKFVDDLKKRFHDDVDSLLRRHELFHVSSVREAAEQIISKCLDDFDEVSEGIYYPTSVKRLHRLRIAVKNVRYALELFHDAFGDELSHFVDETKRMQTLLGEVHDRDVWIAELRAFITTGKAAHPSLTPRHLAAAWLISQLDRQRTKAYRSALDLWTTWEANGFEQKLKALTSR